MSPEQLREVCEALELACDGEGFYCSDDGEWVEFSHRATRSYLADLLTAKAKAAGRLKTNYVNYLWFEGKEENMMYGQILATTEQRITAAMKALGH